MLSVLPNHHWVRLSVPNGTIHSIYHIGTKVNPKNKKINGACHLFKTPKKLMY